MKIVRRKLWSRFWGLVALVAVVTCATALALAYEPNVVRGVRVLGSFLERIPVVYKSPRKPVAPVKLAPVAPPPVIAEPLPAPSVPALQAGTQDGPAEEPKEAPKADLPPVGAPAAPGVQAALKAEADEADSEDEEWDESDELHSGEDEMPAAPNEAP